MSQTSLSKQQYIKLGLTERVLPKIKRRVIKLGHSNIQDYVRWLIVNDLEGLFYTPIDTERLERDVKKSRKNFKGGKGKIVSSPEEIEEHLSNI
jgi:hypothetical protein